MANGTEGEAKSDNEGKNRNDGAYNRTDDGSAPPQPPPQGSGSRRLYSGDVQTLLVGALGAIAVALIAVLLPLLFHQMSGKFDLLAQTVHERVKDSQASYEKQLDARDSNLNLKFELLEKTIVAAYEKRFDTFESKYDIRFENLEKTIASNTKTIKGIIDIKKELTKLVALNNADSKRIDDIMKRHESLEVFVDKTRNYFEIRVARSEGVVGLDSTFRVGSPIRITELGYKYLEESGVKDLLEKYDSQLTKIAEKRGVSSPRKVEKAARYAINTFDGWCGDDNKINQYMHSDPDKRLFNIWAIAGIYFRDVLMERYEMKFTDDDKPEKTTNPP